MTQAYEITSPKARRFFMNNLTQSLEEDKQPFATLSHKRLKQRQSNHSVRQANLTTTQSKEMEPIDETEMLASLDSKIKFQTPFLKESLLYNSNHKTSRNLLNYPSKISLGQSSAQYAASNLIVGSPSSASIFMKDCRQLQQWIDGKEINLYHEMEVKVNQDELQQINNELQQVYLTATGQIISKLYQKGGQLEILLQRTVQGMQKCFSKSQEIGQNIIDSYQKEKDIAIQEMEKTKKKYENYIKNESVEAYLQKVSYLVDRNDSSLTSKQKHKLLIKNVDEFLKTKLLSDEVMSQKQNIPNYEPSGAESALLQLQIISKNFEPPTLTQRPEAEEGFEKNKKELYKEMFYTLNCEAQDQRRVMDRHIKNKMKYKTPTAEAGTETVSFELLQAQIIDEHVFMNQQKLRAQQSEVDNKRIEDLRRQLMQTALVCSTRERIIKEQRHTIVKQDIKSQLTTINKIINNYMRNNFGAKYVDKIAELQNLIEDIILTEDEQKARQKIREDKRQALLNEQQILVAKEMLERKAAKKLKAEYEKIQIEIEKIKVEKKAASVIIHHSTGISPDHKSREESPSPEQEWQSRTKPEPEVSALTKPTYTKAKPQVLEALKEPSIVKKVVQQPAQSKIVTKMESIEQRIEVVVRQSNELHRSITKSKEELDEFRNKPEKKSTQKLDELSYDDTSSENQLDDKQSNLSELTNIQIVQPQVHAEEIKLKHVSSEQLSIVEEEKQVLTSDGFTRPIDESTRYAQNTSRLFAITEEIEKDQAQNNIIFHTENAEATLTMINQLKQIKEITTVLQSYEGMHNIKKDINSLEEIFDNLKIMPAQIDTIATIFGNNSQLSELSQRSSQLKEQVISIQESPQLVEAKQVQQKLIKIRDVQEIVQKAEDLIQQYERTNAIPNEHITKILLDVIKARKLSKQELPSKESLKSVSNLDKRIADLKTKVKEVVSSKFKLQQEAIVQDLKSGDKIEQAIKSFSKAKNEMAEVLLDKVKLESVKEGEKVNASQLKQIKIIQKMDEAVQWMEQIKQHGAEFVAKMDDQRMAQKERQKKVDELARVNSQHEEIERRLRADKSQHEMKSSASALKIGYKKSEINVQNLTNHNFGNTFHGSVNSTIPPNSKGTIKSINRKGSVTKEEKSIEVSSLHVHSNQSSQQKRDALDQEERSAQLTNSVDDSIQPQRRVMIDKQDQAIESAIDAENRQTYQYTIKEVITQKNSAKKMKQIKQKKDKNPNEQQQKKACPKKFDDTNDTFNTTGANHSPTHRIQMKSKPHNSLQSDQKDQTHPSVYVNKKLVPQPALRPNQLLESELLRSSIPETEYGTINSSTISPLNLHDQEAYLKNNKAVKLRNDVFVHDLLPKSNRLNQDLKVKSVIQSDGSDSKEEGDHPEDISSQEILEIQLSRRDLLESPQIMHSPKLSKVSKLSKKLLKSEDYTFVPIVPDKHVLMIPEATQTENRSFLKYLFELINEAMTIKLEQHLVSKEQYLATIEQLPVVYNRIKDTSDSFFLEKQLKPLPFEQKPQLIVTNSKQNLSLSPSTFNHARSNASLSPRSPQGSDDAKGPDKRKNIQFLQLTDFTRYGMHTLDIKKEMLERITVKQVGMVGGGFAAHRQRI